MRKAYNFGDVPLYRFPILLFLIAQAGYLTACARPESIMRSLLLAVLLVFSLTSNGSALVYIEQQGLFLYYPENEGEIAKRLLEKYPAMIDFLERQRLVIKHPLHVILDADLDKPEAEVHMIPHREIRIPLRAPGVLEDGYTESDPWAYFLFKGLCLQGIYGVRSGIPGSLHRVFGEVISPNIIMPDLLTDGIGHLLYSLYRGKEPEDPFHTAILQAAEPPDIAKTSHHPEIWPGFHSYRIYGRPFIRWIYQNYGWERLRDFIQVHGEGIIPIEIDLKAKESLGKSWPDLWNMFKEDLIQQGDNRQGFLITGYWSEPFVYWNAAGIYPGIEKVRLRGRYGYVDRNNTLWLSEYDEDGVAEIIRYLKGVALPFSWEHLWDPGPGGIAVTRKGHQPALVRISTMGGVISRYLQAKKRDVKLISAPPDVLQMSGPVEDSKGRIAVSVNRNGNWDIWVYDGSWHRVTTSPSIEMDPWWEGDHLVFASNVSGRFQIHGADMRQLTECKSAAALPRKAKYLCLTRNGWTVMDLNVDAVFGKHPEWNPEIGRDHDSGETELKPRRFSPLKSIQPNYWMPSIFISEDDVQLGGATKSRDVSRDYKMDAGIRYSFDTDFLSLRFGGAVKDFGGRFTRYPLDYTTALNQRVDESRNEFRFSWVPFGIDGLELSANYRTFEPLETSNSRDDEFWGALHVEKEYGDLWLWGNLEAYSGGSQSLFGGFRFLFGEQVYASIHMQAGKSWGDVIPGHQTYRIGGNVVEGYFTQRPTRLLPLRGFDSNVLDASQALTAGIEVFWPLLNLQKGYETLPLFFHRLRLGTFIDSGAASESLSWDDTLVGAGIELLTSLEIAWGYLSHFRIGIAWPIRQPDILDEEGPVFLVQIGRPL